MSIGLGVIGNNYIVIAADRRSRRTKGKSIEHLEPQLENTSKISMTNFGWAGNYGGNLLTFSLFKYFLGVANTTDMAAIKQCWLDSIFTVHELGKKHFDKEVCEEAYKASASTHSLLSMNRFRNGEYQPELHVIDIMDGGRVRTFTEPGTLYVSNPEHSRQIRRAVKKHAKHRKSYHIGWHVTESIFDVKDADIHKSIYLVACIVGDICKLTPKINDVLDYGISYQIIPGEVVLMSLHGTAKGIKDIYETKGNYSESMLVCGVLSEKPERMVTHG
jgi:hypothetical protein